MKRKFNRGAQWEEEKRARSREGRKYPKDLGRANVIKHGGEGKGERRRLLASREDEMRIGRLHETVRALESEAEQGHLTDACGP